MNRTGLNITFLEMNAFITKSLILKSTEIFWKTESYTKAYKHIHDLFTNDIWTDMWKIVPRKISDVLSVHK